MDNENFNDNNENEYQEPDMNNANDFYNTPWSSGAMTGFMLLAIFTGIGGIVIGIISMKKGEAKARQGKTLLIVGIISTVVQFVLGFIWGLAMGGNGYNYYNNYYGMLNNLNYIPA